MLNDAAGFKRIFIAAGYTDLRREIDGLAGIVQYQFELDPHDKDTIFLFCGRKNDRIKALMPLYVLPYVDNSSKAPEILAF